MQKSSLVSPIKLHGVRVNRIISVTSLIIVAIIANLPQPKPNFQELILRSYPEVISAENVVDISDRLFFYTTLDGQEVGYATVNEGQGFKGLIQVAILWSENGILKKLHVLQEHEDANWWQMLVTNNYFDQYISREYTEPFIVGKDIDTVTGATFSSNGVATAVKESRFLVAQALGNPFPKEQEAFNFGVKELAVTLGLVIVALLRLHKSIPKYRWVRYVCLAFSLSIIGIWLTIPLNLSDIIVWLIGYVPNIHNQLYIFILVIGTIGLAIIFKKNFYCFWLCPFAAVQEIMHFMGKFSIRPNPKLLHVLVQARYFLLWFALSLALLEKNASVSTFEPWGTLFTLHGVGLQWILVGVILLAALVIKNVWCYYLCPIGAVMDIILETRRWLTRKIFPQNLKRNQLVKAKTSLL
ncbi:transcriptional regulator-like protein [Dehalogenimonas sp. WBC-2]|nr:transcriptional regulator-like protein [Dehalogenimonas sp. WBC-2]